MQQEVAIKTERIIALLKEMKHDALLIRRNENLAWITAGRLDRRVLLPADTNVVSILVTRAGHCYYLTSNNEAPRLAAEDFTDLDFEPVIWPWYQNAFDSFLHKIVSYGKVLVDFPSERHTHVDLTPVRTPLLPSEIERYRTLGRSVAAVTTLVLRKLAPGITESEMSAHIAGNLLADGIEPSVLLTAVDDRIFQYKHAVPRGDTLQRFAMLNFCARRAGLCVSITRFVHFGDLPQRLCDHFSSVAEINAALLSHSKAGATSAELFAVAQSGYARAGHPGEEQLHHQGGPCGYLERDWIATPSGTQKLISCQGLAWNPSLQGAKIEDTVLLLEEDRQEVITATPDLPQIDTNLGGTTYTSAGVLEL